MARYYVGRGFQILGLVITAQALVFHFGDMGPMLRTAILGMGIFYLGRWVQRDPRL